MQVHQGLFRVLKQNLSLEGQHLYCIVKYCIYLLSINLTEEDVETVISTIII
jgi:hypothetical protein